MPGQSRRSGTVIVPAPTIPCAVAVIVAVPRPTARTTLVEFPVFSTVKTAPFDEAHVKLPRAHLRVAVSVVEPASDSV